MRHKRGSKNLFYISKTVSIVLFRNATRELADGFETLGRCVAESHCTESIVASKANRSSQADTKRSNFFLMYGALQADFQTAVYG